MPEQDVKWSAQEKQQVLEELRAALIAEVNIIYTSCHIAQSGATPREADALRLAETAAERISYMAEKLLDYAVFESVEPAPCFCALELCGHLDYLLHSSAVLAQEKGIALRFEHPMEHLILNTDPSYINKILLALLSNGIKASPRGGAITLSLQPTQTPHRYCLRLCNQIQQMGDSYCRGAGLSLYLLQKYADLLGWELDLREEEASFVAELFFYDTDYGSVELRAFQSEAQQLLWQHAEIDNMVQLERAALCTNQ